MATVRQLWDTVRDTRNKVTAAMGSEFSGIEPQVKAAADADLAITAVVIKALLDNGILTPAQLIAARDTALADAWDVEPPPKPSE